MTRDPTTVDRLRHDITRGKTEDKVSFPDPAVAPLGTDEEAAGTPPTREERAISDSTTPRRPAPKRSPNVTLFYGCAIASIAAAIVVFMYWPT
jgi:hypothetical protein